MSATSPQKLKKMIEARRSRVQRVRDDMEKFRKSFCPDDSTVDVGDTDDTVQLKVVPSLADDIQSGMEKGFSSKPVQEFTESNDIFTVTFVKEEYRGQDQLVAYREADPNSGRPKPWKILINRDDKGEWRRWNRMIKHGDRYLVCKVFVIPDRSGGKANSELVAVNPLEKLED